MKKLISKLNQGTKIILKGNECIIKTKIWYSTQEDNETEYVKCELSNNKVLVIIPDDDLMYVGEIVSNMKYERISEDKIQYDNRVFDKVGEGNQFIKNIEFGSQEEIEGRCLFEDYESEDKIISLGILTDKENAKADIYADILKLDDIQVI